MGRKKSTPAQQLGTQTVSKEPWGPQQQHLTNVFSEAYQNYANRGAPNTFFPGQTFAPFQQEQIEAMERGAQRAREGSPSTRAVRDYDLGILSGSPQAMQAVLGPRVGELLPVLQSQFNRAGMGASSLARGAEQELIMRELSRLKESSANRLERMGPQEYNDIRALEAIGATKQDLHQQAIEEAMARHQFAQEEPWQRLARYLQSVMGTYGGTDITTGYSPEMRGASRLSSALGGAGTGAAIGQMFGPWGAGIGGLLGGGIGAFG